MPSDQQPGWWAALAEFERWRSTWPVMHVTEDERRECREIGRRIGRALRDAFDEQARRIAEEAE